MHFNLNDEDDLRIVSSFLRDARAENKKIGLTSGCFDLIHFHHFGFFIRCRRQCDILIVGVDSDELVRKVKGPKRPVVHDFHRAIMVDALRPVSFVFIMNSVVDFGKAAKLCRPDVLFKNDSFKGKEHLIVGSQYAREVVLLQDQVDHSSTSDIIRTVAGKHKRRRVK